MSKENVKNMFIKIQKDENLQKKYAQLMKEHGEYMQGLLADMLIKLGKSSGFDFSKDELIAARAQLIDNANSNKELSTDDLANVAGGLKDLTRKEMGIAVSVVFLGLGCAVASILGPALDSKYPTCGDVVSSNQGNFCKDIMK